MIIMVTFDRSADPVLATAPAGFTNINAQAWVRDNHEPMVVLDGGVQYVLVYEEAGSVKMHGFWHVVDLAQALLKARDFLRE
jgi:hypothetical protein